MTTVPANVAAPAAHPHVWETLFRPKTQLYAAILAGALLGLGVLLDSALSWEPGRTLLWLSLAIGMFYGGRPAWEALRERRFDIDVLMVVGAGLAAYVGHPGEGALLLFLFVMSGALEDLAMQRTTREVEAISKLMPTDAIVLRGGEWVTAAVDDLAVGEMVKVRPGDRVPVDCQVTSGASSMDESAITGESIPRTVKVGDELFAGAINTDDPLEARVSKLARESSVQKILQLVVGAREQREPVQRMIDRVSQPYSLGVLGASIVVLLVWWLVLDVPLIAPEGAARQGALYTAITLLIVASPCALVIATPTATLAGIARAARGGVLFKGGQSLERLAGVGALCVDKTGTLTHGRPTVYEVHPVGWSDGKQMLAIAAGLEADSSHPIAAAIREVAASRGIEPMAIDRLNHVVAKGIEGFVGGRRARLGSLAFTDEIVPICLRGRVGEVLTRIQQRGHIAVVIALEGSEAGSDPGATNAALPADAGQAAVIIMADAVRTGADTLVKELHELEVRPVRMLTGDNRLTAARVAEGLGLDAFDAELVPARKLEILEQMRRERAALPRRRRGVGFIGDGVNDAPALAASDCGMAMGTIGTAAAMESADAVLLSEGVGVLPWAIRLARRTRKTVTLNLVFALSVIAVMSVVTLVGSFVGRGVPLSVGVLAHEGGTVLVVLNSLLLLKFPAPKRGP